MPQLTPAVSVVVPYYNEEANIEPVVAHTCGALESRFPGAYEVILVNDGSTDGGDAIGAACTNRYRGVQLHRHLENKGLGAALRTGYMAASGTHVSFIPCDGEVEIDQVIKLYDRLEAADLIISKRNRDVPFHREILTSGWWFLMRLFFGFDIRSEGIYVIRRSLLQRIGIDRMRSTTGLINIEIPMRAIRAGCSWRQETIDTRPRLSGESKVVNLATTLRTLYETLRLRFLISGEAGEAESPPVMARERSAESA